MEICHVAVDLANPPRSFREADSVARRGVPTADRLQLTVVVTARPVFQHRSVVNERVQVSASNKQTTIVTAVQIYISTTSLTVAGA